MPYNPHVLVSSESGRLLKVRSMMWLCAKMPSLYVPGRCLNGERYCSSLTPKMPSPFLNCHLILYGFFPKSVGVPSYTPLSQMKRSDICHFAVIPRDVSGKIGACRFSEKVGGMPKELFKKSPPFSVLANSAFISCNPTLNSTFSK
ncbi:MAG: hypothetical protein BWZ06_01906 [Bacteroidetes bacterium ADurb.BinA261]|nr:MAG: hypothetical protein BWZ06_01906 [Bacteroidetes bacterium ADurb.BinA261]